MLQFCFYLEHISLPVGFKTNIVSSHILVLIIRKCVNILSKKQTNKHYNVRTVSLYRASNTS